jgi:anion-transporting  ArsA/GET3 family ATPase
MGAIDFATTIAPGLRDVLLTGKIKEAAVRGLDKEGTARSARPTRKGDSPRVYDAVVLDAPPTGRIARFLNISHEVGGLARVGPIKTQSEGVMAVLRSPATAVHLVTLLEEMPVQETLDGARELEAVGLPVGGIVVNAVRTPALHPADLVTAAAGGLDGARLAATLKGAGLNAPADVVGALMGEAADHAERVALEERGRDVLAGLDRPTYELPLLADAVALDSLYELAELLCQQGMA